MNFIKKFIGNKSFYHELFVVALPIAIHQLLNAFVNFLDSAMIGRWSLANLGSAEIGTSSIMIANRYFNSAFNIVTMFAVSASIYIAQYMGARHYHKVKQVFGFSFVMVAFFVLILGIFGFVYAEDIIRFFATTENDGAVMVNYGTQYLRIIILTFIPLLFTTPIAFALRASKHTTIPLFATIGSATTNFGLNFLLIYGFNWGIRGAAIATFISRLVELSILLFYYFHYKPEFYGSFKELFSFPLSLAKKVFVYSIPIGLSQIITEGIAIYMFFSYARIDYGNAMYITSVNLSQRIVDMVTAFVGGMGTAASILVGSRLGAGKTEEAVQNAHWQLGYVMIFSLVATIFMIAAIPLVNYIYGFEADTQKLLTQIMVIHALSLPFMFFSVNIIFITRAGGYSRSPLLITNLPYILIKIPLVLFFVFIDRNAFFQATGIHQFMQALGIEDNLIVFIFVIDRLVEVVRAIIGIFVFHFAPWKKSFVSQKEIEEVERIEAQA
ncbi:MAG: MATE family efflux transporter [Bacilli bacterium]|jgi:putative MATE family efflux protein|nr:MATE family efflux transporter [Bacilli bacterium]MCH4201424.1 MATE family efflux transporter [Bacilli bacterium]MCH4236224.1 MATE family efflux transporter [Bacilli bacterium]